MPKVTGAEALAHYQVGILKGIRDLCEKTIKAEADEPPDLWDVSNTLMEMVDDFATTITDEPGDFEDRDRSGRE